MRSMMVAQTNPSGSAAMITAYFAFTVIAYFTAVVAHVADAVVKSDSGR
jgi:hypothetical protein